MAKLEQGGLALLLWAIEAAREIDQNAAHEQEQDAPLQKIKDELAAMMRERQKEEGRGPDGRWLN
jgi:hypothetical protein